MDDGESFSDRDLRRLAELHVDAIDDSLPALLGVGFTRRLYGLVARSDREILLVERADGRVESACVASLEPGSLYFRILRGLLPALLPAAVRSLADPRFRAFLRHWVGDLRRGDESPLPEITYIFTSPEARGRGLGERLVRRLDARLGQLGVERYRVKTLDDSANRAIRFYERCGFTRVATRREGGRRFVEFEKETAPAPTSAEAWPEP